MARFDSIIVGAGHNGLVCAAYLAQAGQKVLVLEAAMATGGLTESREFHPGFHAAVAHSVCHFPREIIDDLKLATQGFTLDTREVPTIGLSSTGDHVVVHADAVTGVSSADAEAYPGYAAQMKRFADALQPFWLKTMPRIGNNSIGELLTFAHMGTRLRRLGKTEMQEFMRMASLPTRDLMEERFENDILKALLSWDGLIGSKMAPRSPNSSVLALLYRLGGDSAGEHQVPAGGVHGLVNLIRDAAMANGAEIRCSSPVGKILVTGDSNGQRACGVQLQDGEEIAADRVISSADPRSTFVDLVGVAHLDIGFTNRIRRLRCDGYVAKMHLALNGVPVFQGLERPDARMVIAENLDSIEFAYDEAKYGGCSDSPVLELLLPTLHTEDDAPPGKHVLSAHVMYVPYRFRGGWTDASRRQVCESAIDAIARYAPGIREQILHAQFLTPHDIERDFRVTGGHWHHTEFAMDQMLMMRPTYEAAQYATPIPGLYLCGAGCHPGGDVTGVAGRNAAREILR